MPTLQPPSKTKTKPTQPQAAIVGDMDMGALLSGRHSHPHSLLGMHPVRHLGKKGLVVRAFLQYTETCEIVDITSKPEKRYPLRKLNELGFFEGFITDRTDVFAYRLRITRSNGEVHQIYDPYSFLPTLSDHDLHLINEGCDHFVYDKLGSHYRTREGVKGVSFAVWAPNAQRISVVGDFNHWDGRYHPMRALGASGIWEVFIPGLEPGMKYKYELICNDGQLRIKADPYAMHCEGPPNNASIVADISNYKWKDGAWREKRAQTAWHQKPISIYEVHLGSWKRVVEDGNRPLSYLEIGKALADYATDMGFTHVEFLPLAEHPFSGSWGYQVTGFFAPTHRYGSPEDFMAMVDHLHQNNIGVILDWVPAHFPRDAFALAEFDGTHLYEHADPRKGAHQDWGTLIFNYGRHEVKGFLTASALSWLDRFHIDGFRVDAVASMLYLDYSREEGQWVPNEYGGKENIEAINFLRHVNGLIHHYYPGTLMIAEESTSFGGVTKPTQEDGLGFDFKWNMGWMHDILRYFSKDAIHRKYHHNDLTFGMLYQSSENFVSVFSHDEVVHGKCSMIQKMGTWNMSDKAQTLRALYAYMWMWPGKNTLFMGCEFGQSSEWHYDTSLDWHLLEHMDHLGIQRTVRDLNHFYQNHTALAERDHDAHAFQWINPDDGEGSVISFVRFGHTPQDTVVVVGNFTPVTRYGYRVGVPHHGNWKEVINTNAAHYGGSGEGNCGGFWSDEIPCNHREFSLNLTLPGLTTLVFKLE